MKRLTALLMILGMTVAVPAAESTLFTEDFSDGLDGWTTVDLAGSNSNWHKITDHPMDTVTYHSPDTSWWCGVDADTFYGAYWSDALLINKICDLSGCTAPTLTFWHYLDIDTDSDDSATVEVSTDSGTTWDPAVAAWTTSSGGWLLISVDMGAYIDSVIQVRFRFKSDSYNISKSYGWFIDDITFVDVLSESTVYANDIEDDADFTVYNVIGSSSWSTVNSRYSSDSTSYKAPDANQEWTCLQSKKLDFSTLNNPKLTFYHYYRFGADASAENWSDGGIVEITTDTTVDSAAWTKLYPVGGYPGYCAQTGFGNPLGNTGITGDADLKGYYGYQESWQKAEFNLAQYAGSSAVWIRFSAGTDFLTTGEEQWYIDDFAIMDQGASDTIYHNDMEDSNDVKLIVSGPLPGDWWRTAHDGFSQLTSSPAYYSADSAAYCGNQSSRYNNGSYTPADNRYALIDNALVSPFIDFSGITGSDYVKMNFRNRRYTVNGSYFIIDARTSAGAAWTPVDTFSTSTTNDGINGGWLPEAADLDAFAANDSLSIRLRAVTPLATSRVYWYLDDIRIVASDKMLVDFADAAVNVPSYAITEKSDTVNLFDIEVFDADAAAPEILTVTVNDAGGGLDSADFRSISNSLNSGISLFDSSGARVAVNASASGWNGLTATVVLQGATTVPTAPVSKTAYRVKLRTSATIPDGATFTVSLGTSNNLLSADNEMLGLGGSAVTTGMFTVANEAPVAPVLLSAIETADSTEASLTWAPVSATDLAVYNVYRDTVAGFGTGAGKLLAITATGDTDYVDTALVMGNTYYYKVTAVDSSGNAGDASGEDSVVTNRLPAMPTNVATYEDPGEEFIRVFWSAIAGDVTTYRVYRATSSGFTPSGTNLLAEVAVPDTAYTDSAVTVGQTYYYVVSAVDDAGGEGAVSGQVDSPVPVVLASLNARYDDGRVVLDWVTVSERDNLGWYILRTLPGESAARLNSSLIPGAGTASGVTNYTYVDQLNDSFVGSIVYTLIQVDIAGEETTLGTVGANVDRTSGIAGAEGHSPQAFTMRSIEGAIVFNASTSGAVRLYNTSGQSVWKTDVTPGNKVRWDGTNGDGARMPAGVYFVRFISSDEQKNETFKFIR